MPHHAADYRATPPTDLLRQLIALTQTNSFSPTYLSKLIFFIILPATLIFSKDNQRDNASSRFFYALLSENHVVNRGLDDGIETLELTPIREPHALESQYTVYFAGNGMDAVDPGHANHTIGFEGVRHHLFWNYPGVGGSSASLLSSQDLFAACVQQVKRLMARGVQPRQITLRGFSLGGGVAAEVARRLHQEGHRVNFKIEQSFARIAGVLPAYLQGALQHYPQWAPLITSLITTALWGLTLGISTAAIMASLSLALCSAFASVMYLVTALIQLATLTLQQLSHAVGFYMTYPLHLISHNALDVLQNTFGYVADELFWSMYVATFKLNQALNALASCLHVALQFAVSVLGGSIALGGLVMGCVVGLLLGGLLSMQLLVTDSPYVLPTQKAFSAALTSACCEMDSVAALNDVLACDDESMRHVRIQVHNILHDPVIPATAALNSGLGFYASHPKRSQYPRANAHVESFWYHGGGHYPNVPAESEIRPSC